KFLKQRSTYSAPAYLAHSMLIDGRRGSTPGRGEGWESCKQIDVVGAANGTRYGIGGCQRERRPVRRTPGAGPARNTPRRKWNCSAGRPPVLRLRRPVPSTRP